MELTPEQKSNLRDIEKAFSDFSDFIKEGVYDQLKYYDISELLLMALGLEPEKLKQALAEVA